MDSILVFDDFKHCFRELDTSNYNDDLVVGSVFFTRDAINVIEKYYRIIGYIICDDKGVYYPIDVRKNDIAFYEKQLAEAKLEVMALEQRLEAIKNDEPAIFPVTAEEIEDINDAYVEYFGDKYGKQTDNHRYADVYIGQMLWAFLTQENF